MAAAAATATAAARREVSSKQLLDAFRSAQPAASRPLWLIAAETKRALSNPHVAT